MDGLIKLLIICIIALQISCQNFETESETLVKLLFNDDKTDLKFIQDFASKTEYSAKNVLSDYAGVLSDKIQTPQTRRLRIISNFVNYHNNTSLANATTLSKERMIQSRWKFKKWIYSNSIIIISEDLKFISRNLYLYGPNVTAGNTDIWVVISKSIYTENFRGFRRDSFFGKMYADLTILVTDKSSYEIVPLCILCKSPTEPPKLQISLQSNFSNITTSLKSIHLRYNRKNGHGSTAWLCRIGFRGFIGGSDYHSTIESNARKRFQRKADQIGVQLGILMNIHNFSFIMEPFLNPLTNREEGNYSGIYLSPGGDMPQFHIKGRQITLSYIIREHFVYCRTVPVIPATGWDFLWSPFDFEIWIGIFCSIILYIVIHKGRISYGLDIFWAVLGLPAQSNWSRSKFLNFFFVTLITLNIGYLSVITSKVIKPNREVEIQTTTELFAQGFRFIDANLSTSGAFVAIFFGPHLRNFKINTSVVTNVVAEVPECWETHNLQCISKWSGLATGLIYAFNMAERFFEFDPEKRDLCHGVKEPFRTYWVGFYFQGPIAGQIYDTHQTLISTGIGVFWERLFQSSSYYATYRTSRHSRSEMNNEPPKLSFKTPVLVVFKAYGVLISICILEFCIEMCFFYCKRCRNNRKLGNIKISINPIRSLDLKQSAIKRNKTKAENIIIVKPNIIM